MKATHSLHSKLTGRLVYFLHDTGTGGVYYKLPDSEAWGLPWYSAATAAYLVYDVRKINTFKGNK